MTRCDRSIDPQIELYFYDELSAPDRGAFDAHLATCADCREAVNELGTIHRALEPHIVSAPPGGDWRPFMSRLNAGIDRVEPRRGRPWGIRVAAPIAVAATLLLGVLTGILWERQRQTPTADRDDAAVVESRSGDLAFASTSTQHFDRSLVVLLGLLNKEPDSSTDWKDEQKIAASLLPDTKLYRMAAEDRGLTDLADTLEDLELVLLQASLGDGSDRDTLVRLQNLIRRRDLLMKIETLDNAREPAVPAVRRTGTGA